MSTEVQRERIVHDLKAVVRDADDLLRATAGEVSEKAKEARQRLTAAIASARESCGHLEEKAIAGAKATDRVIREHPYESLGVAFGIGILLGALIGRR